MKTTSTSRVRSLLNALREEKVRIERALDSLEALLSLEERAASADAEPGIDHRAATSPDEQGLANRTPTKRAQRYWSTESRQAARDRMKAIWATHKQAEVAQNPRD